MQDHREGHTALYSRKYWSVSQCLIFVSFFTYIKTFSPEAETEKAGGILRPSYLICIYENYNRNVLKFLLLLLLQ